jgi:signal transduction histidine kinase
LIIQLNPDVLQAKVFPELARRYMADSDGMIYQVAVMGGTEDKPRAFFTSDPSFSPLAHRRVDAELNLFGPPSLPPGSAVPPRPAPAPPPPASVRAPAMGSAAAANFEPVRFFPFHDQTGSTGWWLLAQHRKGSVEAAVAQLRRRDLTLSFGVLLVLAFTMGLIVVTSQRARQLASLQMDFVAGVSHELRTPLAVISSAAENIVDGVVDDQKRVLEYGTVIRNQARQLSELIEQVLSFASTRKGAARFNLRPLQASEVIDVALESTAGIVSEAGFVVECEIEPGLPEVHADLALLSQCLQNLITNAVKYGGDSRWIGIAAQTATENGGPEVQISVEDHGLGVDPSELEHIFDAFYRSSSAADSPIHGTGLGLSLAKSFAEAMGGKLTVKSQLGRGTCFVVHLPVAGSGSSAPEVAAQMDDPKLT